MSKMIEATNEIFEQEVMKNEGVVLVDFSAEWCGPCKKLLPTLEEISDEMADKIKVVHVDVDKCSDVAGKFGILSVPTLIIFKNGERVDESIGLVAKESLIEKIDAQL
ncbi:MAG: thioredoxin [Candidatus Ancaeobacter aquaticus]|nr:thioredoxin [Candidatus Ancaeobacter aquaticus]